MIKKECLNLSVFIREIRLDSLIRSIIGKSRIIMGVFPHQLSLKLLKNRYKQLLLITATYYRSSRLTK